MIERTVHLYILNKNSPMISSMWSIWSNIHIKGTLNCRCDNNNSNSNNHNNNNNNLVNADAPIDRRRPSSTSSKAPPLHKQMDVGKVEKLFGQLTREILSASTSSADADDDQLEKLYILIREMRLGAQRNYALKKFFWRRTNVLKVK